MSDLHTKLRNLRQRNKLSQAELAQRLGISRQAIIALEQGASLPSMPVILAVLRVFDVQFSELCGSDWSPFRVETPILDESTELANYRYGDRQKTIPIQLSEDEKNLYVIAELPGVKEGEITVDMSTQHVLIMAIKKPALPLEQQAMHVEEISYGPLMRIISLPIPISTETAEAEFNRGELKLILPKSIPSIKRRITFNQQGK